DKSCDVGSIWSDATEQCELDKSCDVGSIWSDATEQCELDKSCDAGSIWSDATEQCELDKSCDVGTIWSDATQQCRALHYSEMSAPELADEYKNVIDGVYQACETYTRYLLPDGLTINTGNKNWFNKLTSYLPLVHTPALIGESGNIYAYKGQLGKSNYFVSGINLWSGNDSSQIRDHGVLQENVINDLLGVDDYKRENIIVWSEDSYFDRLMGNNVNLVSGSDKSLGVENINFDLFIGKKTSKETMKKVIAKGVPIIIAYNHWWARSDTNEMFGIDYFGAWMYEDFISGPSPCNQANTFGNTAIMLDYIVNDKYQINTSTMSEETVSGDSVDFRKIIDPTTGKNLQDVFEHPLRNIRNAISFFDNQDVSILETDNLDHLQIPIYIADILRDSIEYSGYRFYADLYGTASSVDYDKWFKAYFTDLTTHYARSDNKVNNDVGGFSPREDEIALLPLLTQDFTYDLTTDSHVTATGLYIKAGQESTIKRTDNNPSSVKLYINYQRDGATKLFSTGSGRPYSRPAYDRSHGITLEAGKEVSISSPIGGTLFISVPDNDDGDTISLNVKNVLINPTISGVSNSDISNFESALNNSPFNWVTVITKEVQIHSIASKFEETLAKYDNDVEKFMEDIITYTLGNFGYAGYLSNTLPDHTDSVKQFCSELGITDLCADRSLHSRNSVQHIYVDRATCGSLCSGNPYDRFSAYEPGDWGDSHEIGHNLQTSKLKIYDSRSSEVSNNIFPVESRRLKAIANGSEYYDARSNFSSTFNLMKQGLGKLNDTEHPLWNGTGIYDKAFERLGFYNQLKFASGDTEFYTKMYLLQRIALNRDNSDTTWAEYKDRLGFSEYTRDSFKNMNGNDFMAISSSLLIGKDMSQFFEGFGISVSNEARAQIAIEGHSQSLGMGIYFVPGDGSSTVPLDFITDTKDMYFIPLTADAIYEDPTL
ncbi:ImpA family metalloprotease, partial [Vibrio maritimus]|uniref:ImpA family metalloprotease n=1 Tax=Vibrio maritimus TaxID=990268 RepID=UPI0040681CA6